MTENELSSWIGRTDESSDYLSASAIKRLAATLDQELPAAADGEAIPSLAHWLYFLPMDRESALGLDGHAKRGGFLPAVHQLPRRMWAGGRFEFHAPLVVGTHIERRSTILSVQQKSGKSGPLIFVTVEHAICERGGAMAIREEHDIVYCAARPTVADGSYPKSPGLVPKWQRDIVPDAVMLFRYSALTFNGHRIHYDQPYVTSEESYPGLVVHGPLMATLLANLIEENTGIALRRFGFRSMSPMFAGGVLSVHATEPDGEGRSDLWASTDGDRLVMQAEAWLK